MPSILNRDKNETAIAIGEVKIRITIGGMKIGRNNSKRELTVG